MLLRYVFALRGGLIVRHTFSEEPEDRARLSRLIHCMPPPTPRAVGTSFSGRERLYGERFLLGDAESRVG
jgi:hypothetical protein